METEENYKRITITLPPDLAKWVKEKEASLNSKDRRLRTSVSAIIADAVEEMKQREETGGITWSRWIMNEQPENADAQPHSGPGADNKLDPSDGGSKTPKIVTYPKKKRGA
jgi:hypothetical protein